MWTYNPITIYSQPYDGVYLKKVGGYDQELPQSQTADHPKVPGGRDAEH